MQRITGLPDEQVLIYEAQAEAALRTALADVMDKIARRIEASAPVLASALVLVAADAGDEVPPSSVPEGDGLPPGQPYVSPDDLTSIPPLWQQAVADQILPIVGQVFLDAAMRTHANMIDASSIAGLPSAGSLAAEQYLARARNTFEQIGDTLWAQARSELTAGFEAGESIPQLAERLRESANVTARTGVLVARTQVNEASNAGSFETARASGLQMQKEWIATPDLRTRPTHLAADGQRVDLNDPFIVGGFSAMFPAAPSLPPAERYSCRCTIGYVMPDRAPAQVRADDLATQQLEDLPGTTSPIDDLAATQSARLQAIIDEQHAQVEGVIEDVHRRFDERFGREAGPGIDLPARGENPPGYIRPSLREAKTPRQLRRVWQDEVEQITGFPFVVDAMPRGISMVTAREYAEGTLQMFAQFPAAKVDRIHWFDDAASSSYAQVRRGGHALEFNMRYASETGRPKFLAARRRDVAGWDDPALSTSWGVRNDLGGQGVVYHEFTHILDIENGREAIHGSIVPLLIRHAQTEGITDIDDLIKRRISSYATKNYQEMVAEAGTDVMVNGAAASQLSRDIFDLVRAEYRRRGFEIRSAPALPEDLGDVIPKIRGRTIEPSEMTEIVRGEAPGIAVQRHELATRLSAERVDANWQIRSDEFDALAAMDDATAYLRTLPPATRRTDLLERIFSSWTSGSGDAISLGAITGVLDRAGISYAIRDVDKGIFEYLAAHPIERRAVDSLGDAIYQTTQAWFRERGITSVRALRATSSVEKDALKPFTSWSTTRGGTRLVGEGRELVEEVIPVDRIFSISTTGFGSAGEDELVVLARGFRGGIGEVFPKVAAPRALSMQTVAQLRALAKERGIAIPAGARKADLVKALSDETPSVVSFEARAQRAVSGERVLSEAPLDVTDEAAWVGREAEREALLTYRSVAATRQVNFTLRGMADELTAAQRAALSSADVDRTVALMDDAMERSILPDDVIVWRGGAGTSFGPKASWPADLTGREWVEPAYLSTSAEQRLVAAQFGENKVVYRILAPKGTRGIKLSDIEGAGEGELLLQRGLRLRVVADHGPARIAGRTRTVNVDRVLDVEIVPTTPVVDEKALLRAAARERNRLIESSQGTAKLLAEVDELIANKASKAAIRQRLDPALIAPEQVFAGADPAVVEALRTALDTGDTAKLRAALTRAGTKSKLKPIGKAGAKTKFDAETMEGVGGIDIPAGAQVTVVRRGTTLTLPDGTTMQLTRAQVTPIAPKSAPVRATRAPRKAAPKPELAAPTGRVAPGPAYETRMRDVRRLEKAPETKPPRQLGGGSTSDVTLLTRADGQVVEKVYGRRVPGTKAAVAKEVDAEELAPLVVQEFGVRAAATTKTGADRVIMEFVDGETWTDMSYGTSRRASEWRPPLGDLLDSDEGRMLGLADYVMGNTDRNEGNWMLRVIGGRREIVAIDHGYAFAGLRGLDPPAGFFGEFLQDPAAGYALRAQVDVNPADLRVIRQRLEGLRQRFVESGRKTWHDAMMRRLRALEQRADPSAPIRLATT